MPAQTLMIQGCTSDAGKSVLVAGLCRALARRGVAVAPFKPQNMALNSAVAARIEAGGRDANGGDGGANDAGGDGENTGAGYGEIGRAQALQARACFIEPDTDMNPVLLKPSADTKAQVIIHGRARCAMNAAAFHDYKRIARAAVLESWRRLRARYEFIVVEGAGSPAEINLRAGDIANMGFAEAADCPVILIADIDRGGVFAHLVGTLRLLSASEQSRICGFVINKFRGDLALLQPGLDWLQRETGKPVLAVLPYLHGLHLDAEDAVAVEQAGGGGGDGDENTALKIAVPVLPRISNHTDFDALRAHPRVDVRYVGPGRPIPPCDLIILPGSKNTRGDLRALREYGWDAAIKKHLRYGGKLIGICGGYQMLGHTVADPHGSEDRAGVSPGLGLLDFATELTPRKRLRQVRGELLLGGDGGGGESAEAAGYHIHCGVSRGGALNRPLLRLEDGGDDGAVSEDGQILGAYLHGLFDAPQACAALLEWAGLARRLSAEAPDRNALREESLERLADCVEAHLDCAALAAGDFNFGAAAA